jgi:hypothetical protein
MSTDFTNTLCENTMDLIVSNSKRYFGPSLLLIVGAEQFYNQYGRLFDCDVSIAV